MADKTLPEPFLFAMPSDPGGDIWSEKAPVDFRDPSKGIWLVPMTGRIMAGDRGLYTRDEMRDDQGILRQAYAVMSKTKVSRYVGADFTGVRAKDGSPPCAARFFMPGRDQAVRLAISGDRDRPLDERELPHWYFIFLTPDEVLFARKRDGTGLSNIRRLVEEMAANLASVYPDVPPVLSTEVFEYANGRYVEA